MWEKSRKPTSSALWPGGLGGSFVDGCIPSARASTKWYAATVDANHDRMSRREGEAELLCSVVRIVALENVRMSARAL